MNKKKLIFLLGGFSLLGWGLGYYLDEIYECSNSLFCNFINFKVADALTYGMGALLVVFIVLYFLPNAYNAWKKFAIWFVPLAILIFVFVPEPQGFDPLTPYPEQVFQWVSGFYVVVGLLIIGWVSLRNKK